MTQQAHVQALTQKHADLERILSQEISRPSPDTARIVELKREKLKLKDRIRRFSA